jgi:hypothetical protein
MLIEYIEGHPLVGYAPYVVMKNAYKILCGKPEGNRLLGGRA